MIETLLVNLDAPGTKISRHIYGHFAEHLGRCIYGGFYVDPNGKVPNKNGIRLDVVEALRQLRIPNLRWPGGCFADEYHWMDGIGPKQDRPRMINTHWGGVVEDNSFGTHEFMELCALLGCDPYISGNLGSGTVQEMGQWVEYLSFDGESPMSKLREANGQKEPWKIRFWGVGNESWGCGGNMTPDHYSDQVRRYSTYCRDYGENKLFRIACGANTDDYRWTEILMKNLVHCSKGLPETRHIQGLSLHYYTIRGTWPPSSKALESGVAEWDELIGKAWRMDRLIARHKSIMDSYDPDKKVALIVDEWGTWHKVEEGTNPGFLYQQNTIRDALVASLHLDIFHKHADRVRMANLAQAVNVLQAVILTEGEKLVLTPTYHVMEMSKGHQGAEALPVFALGADEGAHSRLSYTVSRLAPGSWLVSLSNLDAERSRELDLDLRGASVREIRGRILKGDSLDAHNSFEAPEAVAPRDFDAFTLKGSRLHVELPARSFVTLELGPAALPLCAGIGTIGP